MTFRPMTTRQADLAMESGKPIFVRSIDGEQFRLLITSRDHRMVRGSYWWNGVELAGTFERASLTLNWAS